MTQSKSGTTSQMHTIGDSLSRLIPGLQREYNRGINRDLSRGQSEGVFARQLLAVEKQLLEQAIDLVEQVSADGQLSSEEKLQWLAWYIEQIGVYKDTLIEYALRFNRSSCALSNFKQEHLPSGEYLSEVLTNIELSWQAWCTNIQGSDKVA
ncbi:hypothetical protein [Halioxenophilus sp. WMMB6]|uniref:hypothetical protein n=1 Tax=Halioxenophilus sp. WMMB6 TaxID=3073815 RepID=UPI00295E7BE3|nr:hypothetical protein [Halioxenophilus sp. WMMB6]